MKLFSSKKDFNCYDVLFEPTVVINSKYELIYFNKNFRIFSQLPPRVLNKSLLNNIIISPSFKIEDWLKQVFKDEKEKLGIEIDLLVNEEKRFAVLKAIPVQMNNETVIIIFFNDLSVERNLYDKYKKNMMELQAAYQQILKSDKLSTMGELSANISHEITNPLTVAKGNLEILEMTLLDKSMERGIRKKTVQTSIVNLWEAFKRIQIIINNMRSFLHTAGEKKEYCKIEDIINKSIELVISAFNDTQVNIKTKIVHDNLVGLVNYVKIEQVVINLLRNAHDALMLQNESREIEIVLDLDREESMITIDVIDNGSGIPSKIQSEIFDMFVTTKDIGEGTGLGLAICTRIMNSHNGKLKLISSTKGKTVFRMSIPMIEASSYCNSETHFNLLDKMDAQKILVLDNEVEVLNVFNTIFKDSGYVFIGSTSPVEALNFLDTITVDLIITDYEMPEMNGSEFVSKVREKEQDIPIFYLSSQTNIENFQNDKDKHNISGFIMKPFSKKQILDTICACLKDKIIEEDK